MLHCMGQCAIWQDKNVVKRLKVSKLIGYQFMPTGEIRDINVVDIGPIV